VEHACSTFSLINHITAEMPLLHVCTGVEGGFTQWFTSVSVRTDSTVPILVKNLRPRGQKVAFSLFGWQSKNPVQATKTHAQC
jgi:hypothetical protein